MSIPPCDWSADSILCSDWSTLLFAALVPYLDLLNHSPSVSVEAGLSTEGDMAGYRIVTNTGVRRHQQGGSRVNIGHKEAQGLTFKQCESVNGNVQYDCAINFQFYAVVGDNLTALHCMTRPSSS